MDFRKSLDRALGLEIVTEEYVDRSVWMTADDNLISQIAFTKGKKVFWGGVEKLAQEMGDQNLQAVAKAGKESGLEYNEAVYDLLKNLRREARKYANERGIQPHQRDNARGHPIDSLGVTPQEKEAFKAQRAAAPADTRKFLGDELYGVFGPDGQMVKGGFYNPHDAEAYVSSELPGEGQGYEVKLYENPKTLSKLKDMKQPLQHGWTVDEIVAAFKPWISKIAWKYHSPKAEYEDLLQQGALGVINALKTDKGEAPIGTHAWRHILGEIRRYATTGGTISGTEKKGAAGFGQAGTLLGYDVQYTDQSGETQTRHFPADIEAFQKYHAQKTGRTPPRTLDPGYQKAVTFKNELVKGGVPEDKIEVREKRGKLASSDAPVGTGEGTPTTIGSMLKGKARKPEDILAQPDMVKFLMGKAGISDKQKEVLDQLYGLDVPQAGARTTGELESPEHKPGEQAGEAPKPFVDPQTGKVIRTVSRGAEKEGDVGRSIVDIAKKLGKSPKAVRQLRDNALLKLAAAAKDYADELKAKGQIEHSSELAAAEEKLKVLKIVESALVRELMESIITGEINCLFS